MKKFTLLALVAIACLGSVAASPAFAQVSSMHWAFDATVADGTAYQQFISTDYGVAPIDPDFDIYSYSYNISEVWVKTSFATLNAVTFMDDAQKQNLIGSGQTTGPAPIVIMDKNLAVQDATYGINASADINGGLNSQGAAYLIAQNVDMGTVKLMGMTFDIQSVRLVGTMDITGTNVPEPMSMITLAGCGVALVARRRRK